MRRCYEPSHQAFYRYGGRGITVCDEWHNYEKFALWCQENGASDGLQLDRIDNDSWYSPDNCRFVTPKINASNRKDNRAVVIDGKRYTSVDVARICGISDVAAGRRIKRWPPSLVLTVGRTRTLVVDKRKVETAHA